MMVLTGTLHVVMEVLLRVGDDWLVQEDLKDVKTVGQLLEVFEQDEAMSSL